ncbi:TetR/AcrR family transcriptional regulator [Tunturiibacter lichenicola]|uniref:TetR/AcrR family transcriptional regulator n=1 Tax=Tunturiibacter lichenicola TaxID=2051959 RepID=UPI0021B2B7CB|nr:TetR/AcrR family transcriptional regulator [Edaphobacter lichenicola]
MRRIIAAGEKLFSKQGFDGTTVQQIADEADVAVGTLFLYVSDKSELLLRIFYNATAQELEPAIKRMKVSRKFLPSIRRFLEDLHAPYEKDRELAKVYCREVLFHKGGTRAELDKQTAEITGAMAEAVARAQARGDVDKSVDPSLGALHLYAIFHAMLAFHLADCLPGTTPSQTLNALLQSAWHGMAPRT